MRANLRAAFETKVWTGRGKENPRSGPGSTLAETARLRGALPGLLDRYGVKTFLDAPCGDWHWMSQVDLGDIAYIGGDISGEVIAANQERHAAPRRRFRLLDITHDALPDADMIMVRDCLMHLKDWLRWAFLENFARSRTPYLLTTVHHVSVNLPVMNNGGFKRFNPMVAPFSLGAPLEWVHETADTLAPELLSGAASDKAARSMAIWSREQVLARLRARQEDEADDPARA